MAPLFSYRMLAKAVSVAVLIELLQSLNSCRCGKCLDEGAEAGDRLADDQVLHLVRPFVGVERFAVRKEASDLVVGDNSVAAQDFSGPGDRLTTLGRAERLRQRRVGVA